MSKKATAFPVEAPASLLPFLLQHITGKSRNQIKSMLSRGQIAVDGVTSTQFDDPLRIGQTVTVEAATPSVSKLPFTILHEDTELIAINKPAGLLSVATDQEKYATAYRILTDYVRVKGTAERLFVVHRLDRDTSGVLLFAKSEVVKRTYQENWDTLTVKRGYIAVVEGVPEKHEGTIVSRLHETKNHMVYSGYGKDGKEAITHYHVTAENGKYALLDVEIDTGRKNQIRVQLRDLGCPVAGDKKYGAVTDPFSRLALHAGELILQRPGGGERICLIAPDPIGPLFRLESSRHLRSEMGRLPSQTVDKVVKHKSITGEKE